MAITMISYECGMCGVDFDSSRGVPECPECEAVQCPCCKTWFDRD